MSYLRDFAIMYLYMGVGFFLFFVNSYFWAQYNKFINNRQQSEQYRLKEVVLESNPEIPFPGGR